MFHTRPGRIDRHGLLASEPGNSASSLPTKQTPRLSDDFLRANESKSTFRGRSPVSDPVMRVKVEITKVRNCLKTDSRELMSDLQLVPRCNRTPTLRGMPVRSERPMCACHGRETMACPAPPRLGRQEVPCAGEGCPAGCHGQQDGRSTRPKQLRDRAGPARRSGQTCEPTNPAERDHTRLTERAGWHPPSPRLRRAGPHSQGRCSARR